MSAFALSFLGSLIAVLVIFRYRRIHQHLSEDHDLTGVQKFHAVPVPRIGSIALFVGLLIGLAPRWWSDFSVARLGSLLLVAALPATLAGLAEDLTKQVNWRMRLIATAFSAALAGWLFSGWLTHLELYPLDWLLQLPAISILFTIFAVTGVTHAFNLIDGYNGLASAVAVAILAGIAYVAFQVSDPAIIIAAFAGIGAILGFLMWNYPNGLIFLGDGGAYLAGFWVAELAVLLVVRNPQVSSWFPLLLCFYPVFETVFTIYRRAWLRRSHPGMPDAAHLHQIIYKRLVRWAVGSRDAKALTARNNLTSPYLWVLSSLAVIPAVLFWRHTHVLQGFVAVFAFVYLWLYRSIVRFKSPRWMQIRGGRKNR
jgi:UDP-N-acetylmuramyl pentapeptide phosphotransferase/UDP-N-acetylglucosamine-1-phosphate transferase